MISFDQDNRRFKYRVAGLGIHDKYVLLTKADQDDYWILPGGRIELLEDSRATLRRELLEETGYEAKIENPIWTELVSTSSPSSTPSPPMAQPSSTTPGPTRPKTETSSPNSKVSS